MTQQPSPFEGTGPMAAQIPPTMKAACMRALSKEPNDRQSTAKQFYAELAGGGAAAPTVGAVDATATAPGGSNATEAFSAPVAGGPAAPAGGPGAAGKTQIGEPFVPPAGAMGPPPSPGAGPPPAAMHHNVPTGGGQAVPAAPAPGPRGGGGGNKGMLIAGAAGLGVLLIVGLVVAFSGGDDDVESDPIIPLGSAEPDTGDETGGDETTTEETTSDETTGDTPDPEPVGTNTTTTGTQTQTQTQTTTKTVDGTAACDAAIAAALGGNCSQARAKLGQCSGFKRSTAVNNVNQKCSGGGGKTPPTQPTTTTTRRPKIKIGK
jgi:serine/threonine-protein kinase